MRREAAADHYITKKAIQGMKINKYREHFWRLLCSCHLSSVKVIKVSNLVIFHLARWTLLLGNTGATVQSQEERLTWLRQLRVRRSYSQRNAAANTGSRLHGSRPHLRTSRWDDSQCVVKGCHRVLQCTIGTCQRGELTPLLFDANHRIAV